MNQLKNSIHKHALNESDMLTRIRMVNMQTERKFKMQKKMWLSVGVAAAMLIMMIASWNILMPAPVSVTTETAAAKPALDNLAYAMVAIDINPSFILKVSNIEGQDIVVEVKPKNDDAEKLLGDDLGKLLGNVELQGKTLETYLINMKATEAVELVIKSATAAGYFKDEEANGEEKYVLVSAGSLVEETDEITENLEKLDQELKNQIENGDTEEDINVVVMKAEKSQAMIAEKGSTPLGLLVIKGMIDTKGNGDSSDYKKLSDLRKNDPELFAKLMNDLKVRSAVVHARNADRKETKESIKASTGTETSGTSEETPGNKPGNKPESPSATAPGQTRESA